MVYSVWANSLIDRCGGGILLIWVDLDNQTWFLSNRSSWLGGDDICLTPQDHVCAERILTRRVSDNSLESPI